jgi:hypothetical protein
MPPEFSLPLFFIGFPLPTAVAIQGKRCHRHPPPPSARKRAEEEV